MRPTKYRKWTMLDLQIVRDNCAKMSDQEIAEKYGFKKWSVMWHRVHTLNISHAGLKGKKQVREEVFIRFSDKEVVFILANLDKTASFIADNLNRSYDAVKRKKRLLKRAMLLNNHPPQITSK